jgi:antitoxin component HigA of HigAB toxin-antitoxin module
MSLRTGIRPITTDQDYEEALAEIKRLWSAEAGSADGQKLEVLAMLAQNTNRHWNLFQRRTPSRPSSFAWTRLG